MTKTLVIAEKPSVAQDIVRALTPIAGKFDKHDDHFESERYVVTSAVGHLVEIQAPEEFDVKRGKWSFANLPVIPPRFDLKPVDKTKSRLNAVVKLAKRKDVTELINACDAGREGELIFRLIEQYAGGAKPLGKPVQRLWLQSMTPQAIRDGFGKLRSNAQMQGLADAARSRSEADWLVGINGTRAMTAFNSQGGGFFLTTVGRVQTPTLSLVVEREEKIRKFVSRDYWEIHASFAAQAGSYPARWFDPQWKKTADDVELRADRVWTASQARSIADAARGQPATVTEESRPARIALIAVALVGLGILVLAPLAVVFAEALAKGAGAAIASLGNRDAQSAIRLTLMVAAIAVPLNAIFGIAAAWTITKFDFRGKAFLITLIDLPFSVSPVVAGLALVLLFGTNSLIGGWLVAQGFPIIFALPGIVLASVFVTFPFVASELIPVMIEQGRAEEEAALTLGASGWRVFRTVTLPNIRWALLYGVLLSNARAMGEFGAVAVVSGKIRGQTATMPITIEMLYNEYLSVAAFSLAAVLTLLALLTLLLKTALEIRHADQLAAAHRH